MTRQVLSIISLLLALALAGCPGAGEQPRPDTGNPAAPGSDAAATTAPPDATSEPPGPDASEPEAGPDAGQEPTADAQTTTPPPDAGVDPARYAAIEASFEAERVAFGAPGLAVAIVENGRLAWSKGFGLKHPDHPELPVLPTTLFRIGSVTKMLTAAGLLQQVAAGKASLEDPISEHEPELTLGADAQTITLRNLIDHTGGLDDYLEIDVPPAEKTDAALATFFTTRWPGYLMAPSGRFYNYSNPNFMLAGLATEKASRQFYRTYLRRSLFQPLGMTRTYMLGSEAVADGDYAWGDTVDPNTGQPAVLSPDAYDNGWARPAGYALSSVEDLARFAVFLMHGDAAVLDDDLRQQMQAEQVNTEEYLDEDWYGYALFVHRGVPLDDSRYLRVKYVEHGGAINGYAAQLAYLPGYDFAVVTLANTDGAYFGKTIGLAIDTLVDHPPAQPWPDPQVNPGNFGRFVGTYHDPHSVGTIHVTLEGTALKVSMPDLDAAQIPYSADLAPYCDRNFILTVQGFRILLTFILDGAGDAEYFRTRIFVGKKVDRTRAPAPPPLVVDRARLLERLRRVGPPPRFLR